MLLPLRPRSGVEAPAPSPQVQAVEWDAGGDARAAVGDELAVRQLGQVFVPGRIEGAGDAAGEVLTGSPVGVVERPAAVSEDVVHRPSVENQRPSPAGTPLRPVLDRVMCTIS